MIEALLFDFNGTLDLIQEERVRALEDVIEEIDPKTPPERYRELTEEVLVSIERIDVKDPSKPMSEIVSQALKETVDGELNEGDSEDLYEIYEESRKVYRDIEGSFVEVVEELAEKYRLFILSHARREDIENLLGKKNLLEYFENVYITREYGLRKPDTEIYKKILDEENLQPEECVMIGDDSLLDLLPAKVAGLHTILFSRFVDDIISDYSSLEEAVGSLS